MFIETEEKCLNFIGPYKAELTQGEIIKKNIFKIRYCHINWKNIDKLERSYELLIINSLINYISLCEHKKEVIGEKISRLLMYKILINFEKRKRYLPLVIFLIIFQCIDLRLDTQFKIKKP